MRFDAGGEVWKRTQRLLQEVILQAGSWLGRERADGASEHVLELYFQCAKFLAIGNEATDEYFSISEVSAEVQRTKLFCINPARFIRGALGPYRSVVFFSATLQPADYFEELLIGGDEERMRAQFPSPFPAENLFLKVNASISVRFRDREMTLGKVVDAINDLVVGKVGNYLVFFPSYDYMEAAYGAYRGAFPQVEVDIQSRSMSEANRVAFIDSFALDPDALRLRFAVMGGLFGEGIDLVGDRLIGAAVVGVGLPQLSLERDLIRDYFDELNGRGFEYAYRIPGMIRVMQAVGRVIRTETDRGSVLLIDSRYGEAAYRALMPAWWEPRWE